MSRSHHNGCTCRDFEITRAEHELAGPVHRLNLTDGQEYTLHMFHAERQTDGSHFAFTTNLLLTDSLLPSISASFD